MLISDKRTDHEEIGKNTIDRLPIYSLALKIFAFKVEESVTWEAKWPKQALY